MIPKIIHYCWLSNDPYPESIKYCINSWKKILPDYELMLWNFDRFPKGKSRWVDEAFAAKKYAFAADYIRLYALYNYGGIYLDSDVEVVKSYNELLNLPYFMGKEDSTAAIEASTLGFEKGHPLLAKLLEHYEGRSFYKEDGSIDNETLPKIIRQGIQDNFKLISIDNFSDFNTDSSVINVFPIDWFSPKNWDTKEIFFTDNTFSIHHFEGSWLEKEKGDNLGENIGEKPLVTIMVPIYNVEQYLDRCVDSLVKQTYQNIEIILVDDGSTDRSPAMCDRWQEIDPRIKVVHQTNQGLLLARRTGALMAKGYFSIFIDSDDWFSKDTCEICVKTLLKEKTDILAFGFSIEAPQNMSKEQIGNFSNFFNRQIPKITSTQKLLENAYIQKTFPWNVCGKMYKTEIINKAYSWLPTIKCNYAEDLFTSYFIYSLSKSFMTIPNKFYHYRVGIGMSTRHETTEEDFMNVINAYDNLGILQKVVIQKELSLICSFDIITNIQNIINEAICSYLIKEYHKANFARWSKLWIEKIGPDKAVTFLMRKEISNSVREQEKETSNSNKQREEEQSIQVETPREVQEINRLRHKYSKHLRAIRSLIATTIVLLVTNILSLLFLLL